MKRLSFLTILTVLLVCGINAQVHQQATVAIISLPDSPGADPFLCVFGNSVDDVTLIDYFLDLDGKEVLYLRQREEVTSLHQVFIREMERLNVRFISIHIYQRRIVEKNGIRDIESYFMVNIFEREGRRIYRIASNNY